MFDKVEAFHRPGSVREALRLLHSGKGRARVVAGGTDVAVEADRSIRILIDITQAGLNYIRRKGSTCTIGATATMADLEQSPIIRKLAGGILAQACAACGSVQIRNMATLGGNLWHRSPAADSAVPLLALEAEVTVANSRGRRQIPLEAVYSGRVKGLLDDALLVEVVVPIPPRNSRWAFQRLGRTELDIALVSVAAGLQLDAKRRVKWMRIALGAVAPAPIRATGAEQLAVGRPFDQELLEEICDQVAREVTPISDVRASAEYRRAMSRVLTRRALGECAGQTEDFL